MSQHRLGREIPTDFGHVDKYPLRATVKKIPASFVVNHTMTLPQWHWSHDQGDTAGCGGHAGTMERSITNLAQYKAAGVLPATRRFDPLDLWREAKRIDSDPGTDPRNDDDGSYTSSIYDVLRNEGPLRVKSVHLVEEPISGLWKPQIVGPYSARDPKEGVAANRWAISVDEMRWCIAHNLAVTFGTNWYSNFDDPVTVGSEQWIGHGDLGRNRGGHLYVIYGASDKRQAFRVKNSWGKSYPLVWMPYAIAELLLFQDGEATVVTDR